MPEHENPTSMKMSIIKSNQVPLVSESAKIVYSFACFPTTVVPKSSLLAVGCIQRDNAATRKNMVGGRGTHRDEKPLENKSVGDVTL